MNRFDIVIINHKKLGSIIRNIHKIKNFNSENDRITIISDSNSKMEMEQILELEKQNNIKVNYISISHGYQGNQKQMIEYMCGEIGNINKYNFLFFMQDHYLDTESDFSKWGKELDFKIKGDVIPDNVELDLNILHDIFIKEEIKVSFCDRNDPCWFLYNEKKYIAPNGSNFIISNEFLKSEFIISSLQRFLSMSPKDYGWAVYVEFMFGLLFFIEGTKAYDIKRDRIFCSWEKDMFKVFPIDIDQLIKKYGWMK